MTETTEAAGLPSPHQGQAPQAGKPGGRMPEGLPLRALPLFYFLHVPKTAGTSLKQVFNRMFGRFYFQFDPAQHREPVEAGGEAIWRTPGFYSQYLMIGGHSPFQHPIVQESRGRRKIFVAVMRDPVARVISHYDFIRRQPQHPQHADLRDRSLLDAFENSQQFCRASTNEQLRYIFGTKDLASANSTLSRRNYIISRVEDLELFVDAIAAISGVPRTPAIPRTNTKTEPSSVSLPPAHTQPDYEEARERIRVANADEETFLRERLSGVLTTQALVPVPAVRPQAAHPTGQSVVGEAAEQVA